MQTRDSAITWGFSPIKLCLIGLLLVSDFIRSAAISPKQLIPEIEANLKENLTDICKMPNAKSLCKPYGVPRKFMPQLSQEVADHYFSYKEQAGYQVESGALPASAFIPLQNEMHGGTILSLLKHAEEGRKNPCEQEIVVAVDAGKHYIVDGHHRTKACEFSNGLQRFKAVHDSVDTVLKDLRHFSGVMYDGTFFKEAPKQELSCHQPCCKPLF